MDDSRAPLGGFEGAIGAHAAPSLAPWSLEGLARGDRTSERAAIEDAREIARALAAQAVALNPDADTSEYVERLRTLERTMWPQDPLAGYALCSSLGAVLVARVAMAWAPPTESTLSPEPLDREGLLIALRDAGIEPRAASLLAGEWDGVLEGFEPRASGLSAPELAALAEGTFTRRERAFALSQIAYSPRCLSRLASTVQTLANVRVVLGVLPSGAHDLGAGYVPAIAALALGRPDRTLDLLGYSPEQPALRALVELARAAWSLGRGEAASLPHDPSLVTPPLESDAAARRAAVKPPPLPADASDDDDVIDIVEERVVTASVVAEDPLADSRRNPRPPRWTTTELGHLFDDEFLSQWTNARNTTASRLGRWGRVLGMTAQDAARSVPRQLLPPDPHSLASLIQRVGLAADERASNLAETHRVALDTFANVRDRLTAVAIASPESIFASARSALRAVVAAAEGYAPTLDAIDSAGDLDWVLRRCRAIALGLTGEIDRAGAALVGLESHTCPEARWLHMRMLRFSGRAADPASLTESRGLAAVLVADLTIAMARSVAGTLS